MNEHLYLKDSLYKRHVAEYQITVKHLLFL